MPTLIAPSAEYQQSFLAGAKEFLAENRLDSTYTLCLGYTIGSLHEKFTQFILDLNGLADVDSSGAQYADRVFWLVDKGEYVGQSSIRPELCTPYLLTYGGHIGYSIRPSWRRQGYGKIILAYTLRAAGSMDLKRVLVTCDSDNNGSRKIIEYNNGQFESAMPMTAQTFRAEGRQSSQPIDKLRYWIDLK